MLEQRLSARDRQRVLEARGLGARNVSAEGGQLVRSPSLVVFRREGRLADEAVAQQALDDAVERAGAEPDGAAGELLDVLEDRVAVRLAVGQRDHDVEHRGREREQRFGIALDHMASGVMALDDIVSRKVERRIIVALTPQEESVAARLRELSIAFERFEHPAVATVEEASRYWAPIEATH